MIERRKNIPELMSQSLIEQALRRMETLASELSVKDREIANLLKRAREALDLAEKLGYGSKGNEFADIYEQIQQIESRLFKPNI